MPNIHNDKILILDFGSQYTQLIARRVRELNIYSEIFTHNISIDTLFQKNIKGIILSGGPNSVYDKKSPKLNPKIKRIGKQFIYQTKDIHLKIL